MENGTRENTITLHYVGGSVSTETGGEQISPNVRGAYVKAAEYRGDAVHEWSGKDRAGNRLTVAWIPNMSGRPGCDIIVLETTDGA
jgi:hypothetical protein